jgi:hypothetical protein
MYLKCHKRFKDGKEHRYWSIAEKHRVSSKRTVDRHVLYLGEINDSQREAWLKTIEAFDEDHGSNASWRYFRRIVRFPLTRARWACRCSCRSFNSGGRGSGERVGRFVDYGGN